MFFDKKRNDRMRKCEGCGSRSQARFNFCPHCGNSFVDSQKEKEEFGLLGRNDNIDYEEDPQLQNMGVMDKLVNSMVNSMMKNLDKQFKHQFKDLERGIDKDLDKADIKTFPNGIRIKISGPFDGNGKIRNQSMKKKKSQRPLKKEINEKQLEKIGKLPRTKAKSNVKRFGDKLVYELSMPGVQSAEDVFVSKLENGYEVKAIGDRRVYVNSVPINLPMKKYSILKNKLQLEFLSEQQQPQGFE